MPITNNASYVPTMNEFAAHWAQVDGVVSPALVVQRENGSAMALAAFLALRDNLNTFAYNVIDKLNDQEIARGEIELQKAALLLRFNAFTALLDGYWAGTAFSNARPYAPSQSDGQEVFLSPMRDVLSLWKKLNAAPAPAGVVLPLTILVGLDVGGFEALVVALQAAYAAERTASQDVAIARATRNQLQTEARLAMKNYRIVVPSRCAGFPVLVASLPALSPSGGHTPAAVNASAVFLAPDTAKVVHEASTDAELLRYELRGNPGPSYDDADAVMIASHSPAEPLEFLSNFGLTQPGAVVTLKVYVVLTMGNEAGSAPLVVQRPA